MSYLGIEPTELQLKGGFYTAKEICQQPELWRKIADQVNADKKAILAFLDETLPQTKRILIVGAGTSAFIGLSLRGIFQRNFGILTEAISTTDLVSHPKDYFHKNIPSLIISFARSGNSPESIAAIALADELCGACRHLIITCNAEGKLAKTNVNKHKYIFNLPPESNDQSLAMTSSYSGMLLTGLLIARIKSIEATRPSVEAIIKYGKKVLNSYSRELHEIAKLDFKRAVFLGSGPFYGTATESHLKLQELSDGKVICKNDSFLGFRHGPKAVVDGSTLVVYLFSASEYTLQYELDLLEAMKKGISPMLEIGIAHTDLHTAKLDYTFQLAEHTDGVEEEFLTVCSVLPAQILGFYKALHLGLRPDAPSASGSITRVVEGVNIYAMS